MSARVHPRIPAGSIDWLFRPAVMRPPMAVVFYPDSRELRAMPLARAREDLAIAEVRLGEALGNEWIAIQSGDAVGIHGWGLTVTYEAARVALLRAAVRCAS